MLLLIVRYSVAPGRRQAYYEAVSSVIEAARQEPGNISYEDLFPPENPDEIVILERWKDAQALAEHDASPALKKLPEIKAKFAATPAVVTKYEI